MNKGVGVDENFKSDFLSNAERAKQKLAAVGPSMCLDKWKMIYTISDCNNWKKY